VLNFNLKFLDLHDNGLSGRIPYKSLRNLSQVQSQSLPPSQHTPHTNGHTRTSRCTTSVIWLNLPPT
jgi:hypothetical protein